MRTLTLIIFLLTNTIIGQGQNLISNSSFEDGAMQLNCQDWFDGCENELTTNCDTLQSCQVNFHQDSPSDIPEELWCLELDAGFPQEGLAETYITGRTGTQVYQLKYWMKSEPTLSSDYSIGYASIGIGSQSQFTASKTMSDTAFSWKQLIITDTLNTQATDTITVRLSAENCDFCTRRVYFDLIELTITDTLTSIKYPDPIDNINFNIYPNPSSDYISITITDKRNENYYLIVYSSTGQNIMTTKSFKNRITLDHDGFATGLYFYQIKQTRDKKVVGRGKFIIQ